MTLADDVFATLPDGEVLEVRIGSHWSGVVIENQGTLRCGLAATLKGTQPGPDVPAAGKLETVSARALAGEVYSQKPVMASVGAATINALLTPERFDGVESNAEEILLQIGSGKAVAVVGRFPFLKRMKSKLERLTVIEQEPRGKELPEVRAPEILGQADVVAITGMTFTNGSLEGLLKHCAPTATVIVVGPSTPLSPVLFDYGVDLLAGAVVVNPEQVLHTLGQGGNFRQVHKAGVHLVAMDRDSFDLEM
jgi:uncharacterized protein (DUF4213/DUF364 family)